MPSTVRNSSKFGEEPQAWQSERTSGSLVSAHGEPLGQHLAPGAELVEVAVALPRAVERGVQEKRHDRNGQHAAVHGLRR
jgi:hypothetical protein